MLEFGLPYVALLTLVLVRTSGIVLVAPIFGTNEVPPTIRAFLAFTLALLVTPVQAAAPPSLSSLMPTLLDFTLALAGELLIGVILGLGVTILFAAFQLTGGVISQLSGMSLGDVFNPGLDESIPLFSHFLHLVAVAVYVVLGGHRLLLGALLDTFAVVPPGSALLPTETYALFVDLINESFHLGLRAAGPAVAALLLSTIVLGLINRSLPQLNIFALGFGMNAITTFAVMTLSLGGVAWLLQDRLEPTLETVVQTLTPPAPVP